MRQPPILVEAFMVSKRAADNVEAGVPPVNAEPRIGRVHFLGFPSGKNQSRPVFRPSCKPQMPQMTQMTQM